MFLAEIATLIGALAALAQVILAGLNHWISCQPTSSNSATTQTPNTNQSATFQQPTQLPVGYTTQSQLEQRNILVDIKRVGELGLLTLILYGILGFCFTVVHASLWLWVSAVLINYWNLAYLKQKGLGYANSLLKTLLAAHIMPFALVIAGIVWASIEKLPIYLPVAVGLAIGIHSIVMMAVFTESFGRVKAVGLSSSLSCSGFVLGWMIQTVCV